MKISVFGLGYVGCVSSACLAGEGHTVIGLDNNESKVQSINLGQSPLVEPGLAELVQAMVAAGRLRATQEIQAAVEATSVSLVCVGTPSQENGSLNLAFIKRVCEELGAAIGRKVGYHTVVIRSTVLPGTLDATIVPTLERASGKAAGVDFGVAVNPEFLREGSAIADFYQPPFTLIGALDQRSADAVRAMYAGVNAPVAQVDPDSAVMVKYACNAYHALKVAFANEIGNLCHAMGLDGRDVMEIFCRDHKLNVSAAYLRPGFAFGGSCLPKDLRAMLYLARHRDVDLPVMESVLPSNHLQVRRAVAAVQRLGRRRVAILGLSFKPLTDDLRESPTVILAETLLGKGYELRIYDRSVNIAQLTGSNRAYIEQAIPHFASLLRDTPEAAAQDAEVVVVSHGTPEELAAIGGDAEVLDLTRLSVDGRAEQVLEVGRYA